MKNPLIMLIDGQQHETLASAIRALLSKYDMTRTDVARMLPERKAVEVSAWAVNGRALSALAIRELAAIFSEIEAEAWIRWQNDIQAQEVLEHSDEHFLRISQNFQLFQKSRVKKPVKFSELYPTSKQNATHLLREAKLKNRLGEPAIVGVLQRRNAGYSLKIFADEEQARLEGYAKLIDDRYNTAKSQQTIRPVIDSEPV